MAQEVRAVEPAVGGVAGSIPPWVNQSVPEQDT